MGIYKRNKARIHIRQHKRIALLLTREEVQAISILYGLKLTVRDPKKRLQSAMGDLLKDIPPSQNLTQCLRNIIFTRLTAICRNRLMGESKPLLDQMRFDRDHRILINYWKLKRTSIYLTPEEISAMLFLYCLNSSESNMKQELASIIQALLKNVTNTKNYTKVLRNIILRKLIVVYRSRLLEYQRQALIRARRISELKGMLSMIVPEVFPLYDCVRSRDLLHHNEESINQEYENWRLLTSSWLRQHVLTKDEIPFPYRTSINKVFDTGLKPYYFRELYKLKPDEYFKVLSLAGIQYFMSATGEAGNHYYACRGGFGKGLWDGRAGEPFGIRVTGELNGKMEVVCKGQKCYYAKTNKKNDKTKNTMRCRPIRVKGGLDARARSLKASEKIVVAQLREIGSDIFQICKGTGNNINSIAKFILADGYKIVRCTKCEEAYVEIKKSDEITDLHCKNCKSELSRAKRKLSQAGTGVLSAWESS